MYKGLSPKSVIRGGGGGNISKAPASGLQLSPISILGFFRMSSFTAPYSILSEMGSPRFMAGDSIDRFKLPLVVSVGFSINNGSVSSTISVEGGDDNIPKF